MTYGKELSKTQNIFWTGGIIFVGVLLFVVLSQPIWNAKHLINQQESDCKAQNGVEIVDHGMFGDYYSCQPYLDKAQVNESSPHKYRLIFRKLA